MSHYSDSKLEQTLADALEKKNFIPANAFSQVLIRAKRSHETLMGVLVNGLGIPEMDLYGVMCQELGFSYVDLKTSKISESVIERIPVKIAWHYQFMPVSFNESTLTIAVEYPLNTKTLDEIQLQLGVSIEQTLSRRQDILDTLRNHYGFAADTVDKIYFKSDARDFEQQQETQIEEIDKVAEDASVVNLVNEIIFEAYKKHSTDIHFEPYRGEFRLRYRIDGILHDAKLSQKANHLILPILSRIKIMANLDIVEHRLPQDGRALVKVKGHHLDLRVSSIPTPHGESIVVRVLEAKMTFDLGKLGLSERSVSVFEGLVKKNHGIILLTGPTGSGKTTTLYACLNKINSKEKKIIAIEDPIEYEIPGITQIQVAPKVGLDFAAGLRSMLRHDPDVMMVGEIRDYETAEIAIRSALTGHLVFSTLHTNDAASGITRLLDIGLKPFLVASSIEAIIAQRLVRVICSKCRVEDTTAADSITKQIAQDLHLTSKDDIKLYKGKGCDACNQAGFSGRTAIHEVLVFDESIKDLVLRKASSIDIKARAMDNGMVTLRRDGWNKVLQGVTTPGEIISVVALDEKPVIRQAPKSVVRAHQRVTTELQVVYGIVEPGQKNAPYAYPLSGFAENISAGGFLLSSREKLAPGMTLSFKMRLPHDHKQDVAALGRVVRTEERVDSQITAAAIVFTDITVENRLLIDDYVYRGHPGQGPKHA